MSWWEDFAYSQSSGSSPFRLALLVVLLVVSRWRGASTDENFDNLKSAWHDGVWYEVRRSCNIGSKCLLVKQQYVDKVTTGDSVWTVSMSDWNDDDSSFAC